MIVRSVGFGSEKAILFLLPFLFVHFAGKRESMEQMQYMKFLMEHALEMILVFDRAGTISYANTAAREKLQYGDDNMCGRHISEVFPNTFTAAERGFEAECEFGDEPQNLVAYRKKRTCFPVEARIVASNWDAGNYICMANDVLEKEYLSREIEQVRQEAQNALKVKSEFVANVTHELRTPVNGVFGNVREMLKEEQNAVNEKALKLIERCCNDMYNIINDILDFSKLETGKFTLESREFNFRKMMDYVKGNHINKITEKGLEFFMSVSPQVPEQIIGDELRIVQILNNLLSNAQKFTSLGKISVEVVRTARVNDQVELFFIVKDSGIGIDKADRDKLFQSFSQVDASISRKYGGTGLGLNICKQLVEMMGGKIEVESKKNKGSTFSFSIWVGLTEEDKDRLSNEEPPVMPVSPSAEPEEEPDAIPAYGTPANQEALKKVLSKLILCVEMENWEKAEMFMETVRQLASEAPHEVKRKVLRLKMAIQKENYEKVVAEFEELDNFL